jgi:hypothetical protein
MRTSPYVKTISLLLIQKFDEALHTMDMCCLSSPISAASSLSASNHSGGAGRGGAGQSFSAIDHRTEALHMALALDFYGACGRAPRYTLRPAPCTLHTMLLHSTLAELAGARPGKPSKT